MKAHIGTDADSGLVHSLTDTAANVADITESEHLLHGDETEAYGTQVILAWPNAQSSKGRM
jgi:IS5 family transposase